MIANAPSSPILCLFHHAIIIWCYRHPNFLSFFLNNKALRGDEEVVITAVRQYGMALFHATPLMRDNRRVVRDFIQKRIIAQCHCFRVDSCSLLSLVRRSCRLRSFFFIVNLLLFASLASSSFTTLLRRSIKGSPCHRSERGRPRVRVCGPPIGRGLRGECLCSWITENTNGELSLAGTKLP